MTERENCDKMLMTKRRKEKMKNYSKARKAGIFLLAYTLLFVGLASWLSYVFAQSGKTFIWNVDGAFQHVVVLKYIRQALITFFSTGKFAMVDYTIGQGFDVIGTLNYYGLGDPVTLLTRFFPKDSLELTYQILALVRMYLSGLAVAYLCKTIRRTNIYSVLPASLLYAFSWFRTNRRNQTSNVFLRLNVFATFNCRCGEDNKKQKDRHTCNGSCFCICKQLLLYVHEYNNGGNLFLC